MNTQNEIEVDAALTGQTQILRYLYGVFDGMALRCCVELRIADIIKSHGRPTTLSEIADAIDSSSINIDGLKRLMTFLVHKKVFDEISQAEENEGVDAKTMYTLIWLLCDNTRTLAPIVMLPTDPNLSSHLHVLSQSIKEGGTAFKITHGEELFEFCSHNSKFNKTFNDGLACTAKITTNAVIKAYRNGFLASKGIVVDVGGGIGVVISEIVKAYPHLRGINFDLPHVISTAPMYDGVTHVVGDMFKSIPPAETIFMKCLLHDWSDDDCIKILRNCRKALSKESGKLVIVEIVQRPNGDDLFDDTRITFDLVMFSHFSTGRERTENEWNKLLAEGGFFRHNIIKIPALEWIIEAFPQ